MNAALATNTAIELSEMICCLSVGGTAEIKPVLVMYTALLDMCLERLADIVYAEAPHVVREPILILEPEPEEPEVDDSWEPSSQVTQSRCKRLLLEILRRAAHDWILYRTHHKMGMRELAEDAYTWLFVEDEEHPNWQLRKGSVKTNDGQELRGVKLLTSFEAICDALDFDPDQVRARIKKMDVKTVMATGRPAEARRSKANESMMDECDVTIDVDVNEDPIQEEFRTHYESYASVMTPAVLYPSEAGFPL